MKNILFTVGMMSFAAALIAQFGSQGIPLFLREAGAASSTVGLIFLAGIPFTLRFIWAPIIDRYRIVGQPRFRVWILGGQIIVCMVLAALFVTDPKSNSIGIIVLVAILFIALGTMLTALGGMIAEGLERKNHSKGASTQAAASAFAGLTLGAGIIYLLGSLGWQTVVATLFVSSVILLAFAYMFLSFGPVLTPKEKPSLISQFSVFRQKQVSILFLGSTMLSASVVVPFGAKSILLIDAGFSVSEGGFISLVLGNLFGFLGALVARPFINRFGGFQSLIVLGLLNLLTMIIIVFYTMEQLGPTIILIAILWANFSVYSMFTANRTVLLGLCRPGHQATDIASFTSMEALVFILIAGLSTVFLDYIGLSALLVIGCFVTLTGLFFSIRSVGSFQPN